MNPSEPLDRELLETLSAYLDGRLGGAEKAALEARLNKEENLRRELEEIRTVRDSLRGLPLHQPPRSFILTPAMAGKPAGKPPVFSPLRLAIGSALATLALVCVLTVDVFSRGAFTLGASAPQALPANESFSVPRQAADTSSAGKSAATAAPAGPLPTGQPTAVATPQLGGGCGDCAPTQEVAANPPQVVTAVPLLRASEPQAGPDFETIAPYLAAFLALAAVLLAILAVWTRKSNHRKGP
jgi:hypothetical protein